MFIMRAAELHAGGFECDAPTQSIQCDLQRQMHEAFKLIIGRLKLGEEDAADLRRRGVPSEIAEAFGFRTCGGAMRSTIEGGTGTS